MLIVNIEHKSEVGKFRRVGTRSADGSSLEGCITAHSKSLFSSAPACPGSRPGTSQAASKLHPVSRLFSCLAARLPFLAPVAESFAMSLRQKDRKDSTWVETGEACNMLTILFIHRHFISELSLKPKTYSSLKPLSICTNTV